MLSDVFIEDRRTEKINSTVLAHEGQLTYDPELAVANLRLFNGTIHQVDLVEKQANAIKFETYDLRLDMSSNLPSFDKGKEHVQEMSLSKLRQTIRSASEKDGAYFKALKEYHKKFSLPGASLVMALLAMPLGIRARNSKRAYGIGLGLFLFLLYYVLLSIGWVLGESGIYPPVIGMWAPNIVILAIGLFLLTRANDEKPLLRLKIPNWIDRLRRRVSRSRP
jgi:lipopolysaccharide export system permease protein